MIPHARLGFRLACLALLVAVPAAADSDSDDVIQLLKDENAAMRRQLEAQEQRLARLEGRGGEGTATSAGGFELTLGGFLKTDMLWNNARVNSTSAPRFAVPDDGVDDQFTATVQHSRIFLKLLGPQIGKARLRGYIETDLFNILEVRDTNFSNNEFRLRQLYAAIDFPTWSVLFGEAWDLFSPLNVSTLNTNGNYWFGGNAGFRRPQIQGRKRFDFADEWALTVAASINTNAGVEVDDDGQILDSGRDAGSPVLEGSFALDLPGLRSGPFQLGVSGLWGEEEFDNASVRRNQWGVGGHAVLPFTDWLKIVGEIQHGANLDAFLMGGGVNLARERDIHATAGWVQMTLKLMEKTSANLMFGMEDVFDEDLPDVASARTQNLVWGGNLKHRLFPQFELGLEFIRFDTSYLSLPSQQANLIWFSGILNF